MLDVISVVDPGYTKTRGQMLSEMNRCPKSQKLGPTFKAENLNHTTQKSNIPASDFVLKDKDYLGQRRHC